MAKIKLGGFFGPSEKIIFEYKFERPTTEGEVKSINMFKEADGDQLGKVEYLKNGNLIKLTALLLASGDSSGMTCNFPSILFISPSI